VPSELAFREGLKTPLDVSERAKQKEAIRGSTVGHRPRQRGQHYRAEG
jgi:hypothetical protein